MIVGLGLTLGVSSAQEAVAPVEHIVIIEALEYVPAQLEMTEGDTIIWFNRDFIPHTATATDERWNSGGLATTDQWKTVVGPDTAGEYFCRYHPGMVARITLKTDH